MKRATLNRLSFSYLVGALLSVTLGSSVHGACTKPTVPPFLDHLYYQDALGHTGTALRSTLHDIIQDHTRHTYKCVWDILQESDEDPNNPTNVILLYTERSTPKTNREQGQNDPNSWNREHVWAKSHGFPNQGQHAHTDAHMIRPADLSVNGSRGNLEFDEGGSPHEECVTCRFDTDSWEPGDTMKGDVARIMFYMDVRYEGGNDGGTPDLRLEDRITATPGSGEDPNFGKLCSLVQWHVNDPVSEWERRRNDRVYEWQGNRNPFLDHPEWVLAVWGTACPDVQAPNGEDGPTKAQLLEHIEHLEADVQELKRLIEDLDD